MAFRIRARFPKQVVGGWNTAGCCCCSTQTDSFDTEEQDFLHCHAIHSAKVPLSLPSSLAVQCQIFRFPITDPLVTRYTWNAIDPKYTASRPGHFHISTLFDDRSIGKLYPWPSTWTELLLIPFLTHRHTSTWRQRVLHQVPGRALIQTPTDWCASRPPFGNVRRSWPSARRSWPA